MTEDKKRKYIGVMFECCKVYQRIYVHRDGTKYEGRCPKCFRILTVSIGSEGTDARMFRAK